MLLQLYYAKLSEQMAGSWQLTMSTIGHSVPGVLGVKYLFLLITVKVLG